MAEPGRAICLACIGLAVQAVGAEQMVGEAEQDAHEVRRASERIDVHIFYTDQHCEATHTLEAFPALQLS